MTFEKVQQIIEEQLSCEKDDITLDARLKEDLDADSLDAVEIAMALEEAFEITMEDDVVANFKTIKDIVDFIDNAR